MFLETSSDRGSIEIVCGCMFSGKTEELIRRMRRAKIAGLQAILFKPEIDIRYHKQQVVSHNATNMDGVPVKDSSEILQFITNQKVVGIDEAQFFDDDLPNVCAHLASLDKRVIIAGLDTDFMGRPFGPMPQLLATAEFVTKLHAICMVCGKTANHSFRKTRSNLTIEIGETDLYEARCRHCFNEGMGKKEDQIGLF